MKAFNAKSTSSTSDLRGIEASRKKSSPGDTSANQLQFGQEKNSSGVTGYAPIFPTINVFPGNGSEGSPGTIATSADTTVETSSERVKKAALIVLALLVLVYVLRKFWVK